MTALVAGLLLLAAPPAGGCAVSVTASTDGSFAQAGYDSSPARLARLAALTRDRFAAAARRLCASGVLRPADLARLRRMVVQNGEGATEPLIYRVATMGRDSFIFQYAFQDGGPPPPAEFERALRCWKRPKGPGCEAGD
ncbi:MAG TPA: hypothetical protein VF574_04720 [Allosphingosinicella sp.]|jgi:hypothetical protein